MQFDPTSDWVLEASIAPAEVMLKNKDPLILQGLPSGFDTMYLVLAD